MDSEQLALVSPSVEFEPEFLAMLDEYQVAGEEIEHPVFSFLQELARRDFNAYVRRLEELRQGEKLEPGYMAVRTFWLVRGGKFVVGQSRVRDRMGPELGAKWGHIGYTIRPTKRGKGYGTKLLALTLEKARAQGLTQVFLVCDPTNIATVRIIEKNGGKYAGEVLSSSGTLQARYRVHL